MTDCIGCDIAAGKSQHPFHKTIVDLGDWLLCHSSESHSYVGHLILTTRQHRENWGDLTPAEAGSMAGHIQEIESALKEAARDDPLERLYVTYFNDAAGPQPHHFHIHLFPRLKSMPAGIAWGIVDVQERKDLYSSYRIHDGKEFVNVAGVKGLMGFLKDKLARGYSKEFNSWYVGQYGIPAKNFRAYI